MCVGGYEIVPVATPTEAFQELEANPTRFGGVITGIRFSAGRDGREIAKHARQLSPDIQVIYVSGDSAADWSSKGVLNSVMASKPFAIAQIITAISDRLVRPDTRRLPNE